MNYLEKQIDTLESILNKMIAEHGSSVMNTEQYQYFDEQLEKLLKHRN